MIDVDFYGVTLVVEGEYIEGQKATLMDPPYDPDFDIETVTTKEGTDLTEMFLAPFYNQDGNALRDELRIRCVHAWEDR